MANYKQVKCENGLISYFDETNGNVIDAKFEEGVSCFGIESYKETPYAPVLQHSKCGIINEDGDFVIPAEYEEAYHLFDDLFAVRKSNGNDDWRFGVINLHGDVVIPFNYKLIVKKDSFIQCSMNATSERIYTSGWGGKRMDNEGRIYKYKNPSDYMWFNKNLDFIYEGNVKKAINNNLIIERNGMLGVINSSGKAIISPNYVELHCPCENRFIARRNLTDNDWRFGVIDETGNEVISFEYKHIGSEDGSFFSCHKECECIREFESTKYKLDDEAIWMNHKGKNIFSGKASVISGNFLKIEKDGKIGVINQEGKKIVNYIYDDIIIAAEDKLAVSKDKKVGILGGNGELVIDNSYLRIECVHMTSKKYGGLFSSEKFGKYSSSHPFDTSEKNTPLFKREISHSWKLTKSGDFYFEKNTVFILVREEYSELFTLEDGILPDSKSEQISALTDISYAVKKQGKWGIYRADTKQMLIPCEYHRIIFEGNHTILLNIGNDWGAQSLVMKSFPSFSFFKVHIAVKYKEIKILDKYEHLFGVKEIFTNYKGEENFKYTILDQDGNEYLKMNEFYNLESQFIYYNDDRILTSMYGKYGFVSANGYVSIPFKYDEIVERDDSYFDVRINNSWGILSLDGKEITSIKYAKKIPKLSSHTLVQDSISGYYGMLNREGCEFIPTIYEHLQMDNDFIIYFGYGGTKAGGNFFSEIDYANWGCMKKDGEIIIPPKYDCYKISNNLIEAGREGCMIGNSDSDYGEEYSGIYDAYTRNGELLFGGYSFFYYNPEKDVYAIFFGGEWDTYCSYSDDWNNIQIYDHAFKKGNGLWLLVNKDFLSIIRNSKGEQYQFKKGFIWEKNNMPLQYMVKGFEKFDGDNIIIANSNGEDNRKVAALNIESGKQTEFFDKIESIDSRTFFIADNSKVGIITFDNIVISPKYLLVTNPINGYYFAVKELDDNNSMVTLRSIRDISYDVVAISSVETRKIISDIFYGLLLIKVQGNADIANIIVSQHRIFDKSFIERISPTESQDLCKKGNNIYWFSTDYRLDTAEEEGFSSSDYDDSDYMRDTWDAMTDGMYGDMPDGFDGDFDFLGR